VTGPNERLQKYLAHAGIASRRHAEALIETGQVTVNGRVVRELGTRVTPGSDEVRVRGQRVETPKAGERLYILLNKPRDASPRCAIRRAGARCSTYCRRSGARGGSIQWDASIATVKGCYC
jgi:16S rRNA U516 pseudouridylate synthase RsuA-like enzyme